MYSTEAILEAAHAIRPYLSELLGAELAIEIDQKLVDLLAQAEDGQSVENLILELLAAQASTREWLSLKLFPQQSHYQTHHSPTRRWEAEEWEEETDTLCGEEGTDYILDVENIIESGLSDSINGDIIYGDRIWGDNKGPLNDSIQCYVHAEMDTHVIVQRITTIEVMISKDAIEFVSSATAKREQIQIDSLKALIVQVIPKVNFESVGDTRFEVESLNLETPQHLYFDLRPTHLGDGEVWVVLRQSQLPLLTLPLTPQIVESRAQIPRRLSANGSIQNIPTLSEPLHQLRIIERRNGTQITYDYELDSPSLNILGRYESKPIMSDRQQYVETLYREIESRWRSVQEDVDAFAAELRGFGGQLLDELFPEALQRQLWEHRQSIQSIMVISTEPFIPWELVHLKPPGQAFLPDEVCFLGQLGLVRWLYDVGFPPESITLQPDRCRYVIPHYPDSRYRLPQAEQEAQFLEQTFQATAIEPQPNPVRQALESASFDLLHFAGHGQAEHGSTATANLLLEGRIEGGKYISASLSATTVSQHCRFKTVKNQPIVLLNACQIGRTGYDLTGISGFAQAFLRGGAGAFIGSLWSVGDRPARVFSETLYSALIAGANLAEATRKAREKAKAAGDATWLAYVVYGHPYLKVTLQEGK